MKKLGMSATHARKIVTLSNLIRVAEGAKKRGKRIVTTNGCFDILHVGHVRSLTRAKELGDILIVGVNSDDSARRNKPHGRPVIPARERAEMLAAIDAVDYVLIFNELTPDTWLGKVRPHIHAKGSDRALSQVVERETVRGFGGVIVLLPHTGKHSTTKIIHRIAKLAVAPTRSKNRNRNMPSRRA